MYYTDLPRSRSVTALHITRMTYDEDEIDQRRTAVRKSKSDAQIIKDLPESPAPTKTRPKSGKKKPRKGSKLTKLQLKREKRHLSVVDEIPIIEMTSTSKDKKDKVHRVTPQVQMDNWCKSSQDDKSSVEHLKPVTKSSPMLNSRTVSTLSSRISDAKAGISYSPQKRKPARDKASAEVSVQGNVQGNVNTIRMNVSGVGSQYICGSGLPRDKSYLNITAKQFL